VKLGATALVLLALAPSALSACTSPSSPSSSVKGAGVDRLVAEGPSALTGISVVAATGREAAVPAGEWARVAPLVAARRLSRPEAPAAYGLDHPRARLVYRRRAGGELDVEVGADSFDGHLVYARRATEATVYLLAADTLRPYLALVGVALPPPG